MVRPRLLDQLRGRFEHPVTRIVGGPGSGKSTLINQAIAENRLAPIGTDLLVTCDATHRVASRLASAFAEVVGVDPRPGEDAPDLVARALEHAARRWPFGATILLDDLHLLDGSPGESLLVDLVHRAPPPIHLVLVSRTPLDGLPLRGDGPLLDERSLRFDDQELAALAALRGVDPASLQALDGWPAIADLAATMGIAGAVSFVQDEVVVRLDADVRRRLAILAHVGDGDDSFRAAALGHPVPDPLLPPDIPLVRHDGARWSVHALWTRLLADSTDTEAVTTARQQVTDHLLAAGEPSRAAALNLDAGDWPAFERAVTSLWQGGYVDESRDVLADWLDRLPDEQRTTPAGLLLRGAAARVQDSFGLRSRDLLEGIIADCRAAGTVPGEMLALGEYAYVCRARGEIDRLFPVMARLDELARLGHQEARPFVTLAQATLCELQGDDHDALELLATLRPPALSAEWMTAVAYLQLNIAGRLGDEDGVRRAAADCARYGPQSPPGRYGPAVSAWYLGEPRRCLDTLPDLATERSLTKVEQLFLGSRCAIVLASQGRTGPARHALAVSRSAAADMVNPAVAAEIALATAALAIAEGDEAGARHDIDALYHALGPPLAERLLRTSIGMVHVLVPELRDQWEQAELGPMLARGRQAARLLLGLRGQIPLLADDDWPDIDTLATALPLRWSAEVACRAAAEHPTAPQLADRLLQLFGADARTALRTTAAAIPDRHRSLLAELPAAPTAPLELRLLGPTRLQQAGDRLSHPALDRPMVRTLLAYLALRGPADRATVAAALWPSDPPSAANNLRTHLGLLLQALEPGRLAGEAAFFVVDDEHGLGLVGPPHLVVDVHRFDAVAALVDTDPERLTVELLEEALASWHGEPLLDLAPLSWVEEEQDRLRRAMVRTGLAAGRLHLAHGSARAAVTRAIDALQVDPWSEAAYQILVAGHLEAGDRAAARRALHRAHAMLADLGVRPREETTMLERRLHLSTS